MDWKNAKRSLPFAGRARFVGSKKTAPCPHCGSPRYGYHQGRFKDCLNCGYDRAAEKQFDVVRFLMINERGSEIDAGRIKQAEDYYRRVYRVNAD